MKLYSARALRILNAMEDNSLFILHSASTHIRSHDTEYPFRQKSDFYYLSGFLEDGAVLLFRKEQGKVYRALFLHERDEEYELWMGERLGTTRAKVRFDYDDIYPIEQLDERVSELMCNMRTIYCEMFGCSEHFLHLRDLVRKHNAKRETNVAINTFKELSALTQKMRLHKDAYEIETIKKAIAITKEAHHYVMQHLTPQKREYEVQAEYEYIFRKNGAQSDAYSTIVAGGNRGNILHYVKNDKPLLDGELVLIDAGCEYNMYASDITRTLPVNGVFSAAQAEVYQKVLDVQKAIIAMLKVGSFKSEVQAQAEVLLTKAMVELGLLEGEVSKLISEKLHKKYFPHGIGHWMGIDVHDEALYYDENGEDLLFKEGMVMTIEPGLYIREDDMQAPKAYRGIAIRIEDDILITNEGPLNLSKEIVKEIADIEAMMRG